MQGREGLPKSQDQRAAALLALRDHKMAESPHAYVRGTAPLFYELLTSAELPAGPDVWINGDCHAENIGALRAQAVTREAVLALNDLDGAARSTPAYDLVRLSLSLLMAARSAGFHGLEILQVITALVAGYRAALHDEPSQLEMTERLRRLVERAARRSRKDMLDDRVPKTSDGRRHFALGKRYWPLSSAEREAVFALVHTDAVVELLHRSRPHEKVQPLDAAFRIAGTASLGAFRAAVLVQLGEHERLLDVKEALPSPTPWTGGQRPTTDADRVVAGAQALSPALAHTMVAARLFDRPVVVRELVPQDQKVSLDQLRHDEAGPIAQVLGHVVGSAHRRQMTVSDAHLWSRTVLAQRDARTPPAWLWSTLATLAGAHESAYLRHCERVSSQRPPQDVDQLDQV